MKNILFPVEKKRYDILLGGGFLFRRFSCMLFPLFKWAAAHFKYWISAVTNVLEFGKTATFKPGSKHIFKLLKFKAKSQQQKEIPDFACSFRAQTKWPITTVYMDHVTKARKLSMQTNKQNGGQNSNVCSWCLSTYMYVIDRREGFSGYVDRISVSCNELACCL